MTSWRTLFGGGPCSTLSPVVVVDPGRKNVWRFEVQDALVGYRWNGSAWAAEWRAPVKSVHPQGLFAYYDADQEEVFVGTVNVGTSKVSLRPLSAPREAKVLTLPQLSDFAGLAGLDDEGDLRCVVATYVPEFGVLLHVTPVDAAGFTFRVEGDSLVQMCRGPELRSVTFDEEHGVIGAFDSTFSFNGEFWEDLECPVASGVTGFPGQGAVALQQSGERYELVRVPSGEPLGDAGATPCRVLVSLADDSTPLEEAALLMVGGELASSQTHLWRAGAVTTTPGLQGCAPSQVFGSHQGVIASDAATRAIYRLDGRAWNLIKAPLPDARLIDALTMNEDGDAFAMTRDGDLFVAPFGESQWTTFATMSDDDMDEVDQDATIHLAWDERSSRLVIQVAASTWTHDGETLTKLDSLLPGQPSNLVATPVGVYALVDGQLWLFRKSWFKVDMYPVPASAASLLFDAAHGLLAVGPTASFFLTAHGWERFDGGPGREALAFAMDRTTGSLMAFGDSFVATPPIFVRSVPPSHVHPLPVGAVESDETLAAEDTTRRTDDSGDAGHVLSGVATN
ncbi:MAG: hypothetical protein ACI9KE_001234 [Polyangiales bacterium]|jgi:hypothetical protein